MNLTDVDTEINKTVDRLVSCPKNQVSKLTLKLQNLWKKRRQMLTTVNIVEENNDTQRSNSPD